MPEHIAISDLEELGSHLAIARGRHGLSQAELAARSGLTQTHISYFERGEREPTLAQLLRLAKALDAPLQRFLTGGDRPGATLHDLALELRHLGMVDLRVDQPIVPGAFRPMEEVVSAAIAGLAPDPRVVEGIPAILAWNRWSSRLLKAYGQAAGRGVVRRLAWLADIVLAIDKQQGFPGQCPAKRSLEAFVKNVRIPDASAWDDLGRPSIRLPVSPLWRRWKINYDAHLNQFRERALHLQSLRAGPGARPVRRKQ